MEKYLNQLLNSGKEVRLFFVNGFQDTFKLLDFEDDHMLVMDKNGRKKVILMHAVSTINLD